MLRRVPTDKHVFANRLPRVTQQSDMVGLARHVIERVHLCSQSASAAGTPSLGNEAPADRPASAEADDMGTSSTAAQAYPVAASLSLLLPGFNFE